jgi:uncharacterized protein YgiM (DUF1202 family)
MRYALGRKRWIIPAMLVVLGGAMVLPSADEPTPQAASVTELRDAPLTATPEQEMIAQLRSMALVEAPEAPVVALAAARAPVVEPPAFVPPAPEPADISKASVTAAALNVRSGPSTSAQPLGRLTKGTIVELRSSQGQWREIATADGVSGWVYGDYLAMQERG